MDSLTTRMPPIATAHGVVATLAHGGGEFQR